LIKRKKIGENIRVCVDGGDGVPEGDTESPSQRLPELQQIGVGIVRGKACRKKNKEADGLRFPMESMDICRTSAWPLPSDFPFES
jgi:hypothetical protein